MSPKEVNAPSVKFPSVAPIMETPEFRMHESPGQRFLRKWESRIPQVYDFAKKATRGDSPVLYTGSPRGNESPLTRNRKQALPTEIPSFEVRKSPRINHEITPPRQKRDWKKLLAVDDILNSMSDEELAPEDMKLSDLEDETKDAELQFAEEEDFAMNAKDLPVTIVVKDIGSEQSLQEETSDSSFKIEEESWNESAKTSKVDLEAETDKDKQKTQDFAMNSKDLPVTIVVKDIGSEQSLQEETSDSSFRIEEESWNESAKTSKVDLEAEMSQDQLKPPESPGIDNFAKICAFLTEKCDSSSLWKSAVLQVASRMTKPPEI